MTAHPFVLGKLERSSLAEQAVQSLLQHIQETRPGPGAALPSEARLGELLGVSRTVVREALRTLKGMGVVEIANGKSPTVRRDLDASALGIYFSRALQVLDNSTEDLMDVRASLEGRAAVLAALRRTPEQLDRMSELVVRMQAQLRRPLGLCVARHRPARGNRARQRQCAAVPDDRLDQGFAGGAIAPGHGAAKDRCEPAAGPGRPCAARRTDRQPRCARRVAVHAPAHGKRARGASGALSRPAAHAATARSAE
jgi:DNA-binding transcriptional regulator YhcF (GntR family)